MNAVASNDVAQEIRKLRVEKYIQLILLNYFNTNLNERIGIKSLEDLKEIQKLLNKYNHKIKLQYNLSLDYIPNDVEGINFKDVTGIELKISSLPNKELLHQFLGLLNKNTKILFTITDMSCIDLDSLEYIKEKFKKNVIFQLYDFKSQSGLYMENHVSYNNYYDALKMIKIKKRINEIIQYAAQYKENDRIIAVCNLLTENFKYNTEMKESIVKKRSKFENESLYNALINKTGIDSCLSVALFNLLRSCGIDCQLELSEQDKHIVTQGEYELDLTQWLETETKKYIK